MSPTSRVHLCAHKKSSHNSIKVKTVTVLTVSALVLLTVSPVMFGVCRVIDRLFCCRTSSVLFFQSHHILICSKGENKHHILFLSLIKSSNKSEKLDCGDDYLKRENSPHWWSFNMLPQNEMSYLWNTLTWRDFIYTYYFLEVLLSSLFVLFPPSPQCRAVVAWRSTHLKYEDDSLNNAVNHLPITNFSGNEWTEAISEIDRILRKNI